MKIFKISGSQRTSIEQNVNIYKKCIHGFTMGGEAPFPAKSRGLNIFHMDIFGQARRQGTGPERDLSSFRAQPSTTAMVMYLLWPSCLKRDGHLFKCSNTEKVADHMEALLGLVFFLHCPLESTSVEIEPVRLCCKSHKCLFSPWMRETLIWWCVDVVVSLS